MKGQDVVGFLHHLDRRATAQRLVAVEIVAHASVALTGSAVSLSGLLDRRPGTIALPRRILASRHASISERLRAR
jgi:hypothetical protein